MPTIPASHVPESELARWRAAGLIVGEQGCGPLGGVADVEPGRGVKRAEMSEAEFLRQFLGYAKLRGWRSAHFRPGMDRRGNWQTAVAGDGKGFFDTFLIRERLVMAELKVGRNRLTPEQRTWFAAYKRAGVECYVWYPTQWDEIERVLS